MRLKTSFFSAAIFRKNISRFYLLVLLFLAAQCVALPITLSTSLAAYQYTETDYASMMYNAVRSIYVSTQITAIISFVGACAAAMAVFSYLFSARSANMMAALPIRREAMFVSSVAAVFAVVIISDILAVFFAFGVTMPAGLMLGKWLLEWLGIALAQFTLFFGIAVLSAVVTGSTLAMPAIYLAVNFISAVLAEVFTNILSDVMFGISVAVPEIFYKLSPIVYFFSQSISSKLYGSGYTEAGYDQLSHGYSDILPWYVGAAVILFAAAFFIHRRRHMETAGDVVSLRLLRPVFSGLFTLCCGYIGGYLFYSVFLSYGTGANHAPRIISCVAVVSLLGYILADMMIKKSTRISLKRTAAPAAIIAALLAGSVWAASSDIFGREVYVPEAPELKSVELMVDGERIKLDSEEGIGWITALHHTLLDNRKIHENSDYMSRNYVVIDYELEDGTRVSRQYDIRRSNESIPSDEEVIMNNIMNKPESILYRKQTTIPFTKETIASGSVYSINELGEVAYVNLTPEQTAQLYLECILPDMKDGTIGLIDLGVYNATEFYSNQIEIYLYEQVENMPSEYKEKPGYVPSEYFYTFPTNKSLRTNKWLTDHGVRLAFAEEGLAEEKMFAH